MELKATWFEWEKLGLRLRKGQKKTKIRWHSCIACPTITCVSMSPIIALYIAYK